MKLIKVAAAVLNQTPLDWAGNTRNILAAIADARAAGASILCLPELAISGYGCEDAFHAPFVARTAWAELVGITKATNGMVVAVGLPRLTPQCIVQRGRTARGRRDRWLYRETLSRR